VSGSLSNYQSRQENVLKYTTVAGVDGFDGTRKEAPKQWLKPLFNILKSNKNSVNTYEVLTLYLYGVPIY
jgi:hypothetical protein